MRVCVCVRGRGEGNDDQGVFAAMAAKALRDQKADEKSRPLVKRMQSPRPFRGIREKMISRRLMGCFYCHIRLLRPPCYIHMRHIVSSAFGHPEYTDG